jgi:uncharacterized membrane protein YdjX (TVP38/TMEM64 family)
LNKSKLLLLVLVALLVVSFFALDLEQYLNLSYLKSQQVALDEFYQQNSVELLLAYFATYVMVAGLSLPGAVIMTLAGGAVFGFWTGLVVISFASSIGATLAFLVARFLLRDTIQAKFSDKLETINKGIEADGAMYLFSLRLIPLFPFFVVNLVMGLMPISTWSFYWVSQLGMLAGTAVFVNAGTQLAQLESLSGILSPEIMMTFVLLGIFPWLAKLVMAFLKKAKEG